MGKPRLIILIRHAQSEGNKNRAIHQVVPDHRVKLTEEGHLQAEDAGRRLRHLLKDDDTLQIFTSPYRRTRETTEGILRTLTAPHIDSPNRDVPIPAFSREKIKVFEEPRLREQDFGNFQPGSDEMSRMWQERADYGHFFYRIQNGESAADAYDRVAGFNESLWRQFEDHDFPSVLALVTHGLMTRVFLMKWYHWSVEYFEDLRNINHCEFILMNQSPKTGKYSLDSQLRTWSELKRQRDKEAGVKNPSRRNTLSAFLSDPEQHTSWKWCGCVQPCEHDQQDADPRKWGREEQMPAPAATSQSQRPNEQAKNEAEDHPLASQVGHPKDGPLNTDGTLERRATSTTSVNPSKNDDRPHFHSPFSSHLTHLHERPSTGVETPHERPSTAASSVDGSDSEYFRNPDPETRPAQVERKPTREDIARWMGESGMGTGQRADALGDEPVPAGDEEAEPESKHCT